MLDKDAAPGMRWYSILSASSPGDLGNANAGGDGADQNAPLHVFPGVCQVTVVQNTTQHAINTDNPILKI